MIELIESLSNAARTVIDYDVVTNGTLFVLMKSKKGCYSIRQIFRNRYGEYNGFYIVRRMSKVDESIARMEFADYVEEANSNVQRKWREEA